jgi:MFS family permease
MLALRADYFGRKNFGKIMGASQFIMTSGMVIGPLFSGLLADRTGDYEQGFIILACVALLGSIFFILLRKPSKTENPLNNL